MIVVFISGGMGLHRLYLAGFIFKVYATIEGNISAYIRVKIVFLKLFFVDP